MVYEIRQRTGDGKWAMWRPSISDELASNWECVAVFDTYEEADQYRQGLRGN